MFSRMGSAAFKKDLTNIRLLCDHVGNPQQSFKSIHVAGTNGKGSTSHMLAAIFQTAGFKTGLYTSPHLYDFRERIRLNGELIPEETVVRFVESLIPLIEEIEPSFFEITVAMAFQYFAEQNADIAIIEVGLGGRLDSTNIITPELSVITNIGWDHMNLLGDSLEEIAVEKAGIIKPGIPVVIGETLPETKKVFERIAKEARAPVFWAENRFSIESQSLQPHCLAVKLKTTTGKSIPVQTDLPGVYQVQNLRTVLTSVEALRSLGWSLTNDLVATALKSVKEKTGLGGRWEVLQQNPTVVLEVAHNVNGMEKMMEHVRQLHFRRLHIVIGMVKDKDPGKVLSLLPKNAAYYFTQAAIPRALSASALQKTAADLNISGEVYNNVNLALQAANGVAAIDDLILVCGSIFLIAEVDKSQYVISPNRSNA